MSTGAGKTTLLNALAGHTPISSGKILLDAKKMSKKMKRQVSYVQQADLFFPNLTLRETLRVCLHLSISLSLHHSLTYTLSLSQYSALIRLPSELSIRQKLNKVEEIITTLRLQDCASTRTLHSFFFIKTTHVLLSPQSLSSPPLLAGNKTKHLIHHHSS